MKGFQQLFVTETFFSRLTHVLVLHVIVHSTPLEDLGKNMDILVHPFHAIQSAFTLTFIYVERIFDICLVHIYFEKNIFHFIYVHSGPVLRHSDPLMICYGSSIFVISLLFTKVRHNPRLHTQVSDQKPFLLQLVQYWLSYTPIGTSQQGLNDVNHLIYW